MPFELNHHAIAIPYFLEVISFLLGVVVIVPFFKKLRLSPILGFLALGTIIGPHALAVIEDGREVQHLAELGVIFLLFTIGLELSFDRLKTYSGLIFGLGTSQVLLCSIAIGGIAYAWGNSAQAAIVIGLCLSLSSTAMVMQLLTERGELATKHGRSSFSVLLFQDLAVVPILILLAIFGKEGENNVISSIFFAVLNAVIAITLIVTFGRFGLRKLFEIASKTNSIDVFTAMSLLCILTISAITGIAGLSMALGAFLAGLLLAETEFRHQIEAEIEPFKGLFLGLFFMSVGMNIDLSVAMEKWGWVILSVIGLIAIKGAIIFACAVLFRLQTHQAIRTAFLLSEGGEFAFVVIGQATLTYNIVPNDTGQFMIVVAGISMILTPLLAAIGHKLGSTVRPRKVHRAEDFVDTDIHDHIIIAGYGRVGAAVAKVLRAQTIPYVGVDSNAESIHKARESDKATYVGDASRAEVLKRLGADKASALLITMNSPEDAIRTLHVARQQWPNLIIIARSVDEQHSTQLVAHGATQVVMETLEASLQLSNYVLRASGFSRDEANNCIDLIRAIKSHEQHNDH